MPTCSTKRNYALRKGGASSLAKTAPSPALPAATPPEKGEGGWGEGESGVCGGIETPPFRPALLGESAQARTSLTPSQDVFSRCENPREAHSKALLMQTIKRMNWTMRRGKADTG